MVVSRRHTVSQTHVLFFCTNLNYGPGPFPFMSIIVEGAGCSLRAMALGSGAWLKPCGYLSLQKPSDPWQIGALWTAESLC